MKNLTVFFFAFFFLAFFNSAQSQQGSQTPVAGLSYAPDSNYVIVSRFYKGRNGVALWVHKDSVNWIDGLIPKSINFVDENGKVSSDIYLKYDTAQLQKNGYARSEGIQVYGDNISAFRGYIGLYMNRADQYADSYGIRKTTSGYGIDEIIGLYNGSRGTREYNTRTIEVDTSIITQYNQSTIGILKYNRALYSIIGRGKNTSTGTGNIRMDSVFTFGVADNDVGSLSAYTNYSFLTGGKGLVFFPYARSGVDNNYTIYAPAQPLYTNQNGRVLTAPLDSFSVLNPAGGSGTLRQVLSSIYSATTTGVNFYNSDGSITANRTVTGGSNNLDFVSMGNFTATGAGSATYRFNLYPSSSLPVLVEQTSAGDTAYLQLRASLGRATLRATQDIYLEAASSVFVSTLEGTSTGIISARPTGELIRREEAFFNAYFISDTITVAASETEINSTFLDAVSPSFTVLGDSIIYTGTDTAYFDIGYYTEAEVLESATGTYLLELSCYKNGVKVFPSESWHRVYFTASETEPIETIAKRFTTQLVTGDVLNIRQNGTTGISAALHNFSFTGQKLQ